VIKIIESCRRTIDLAAERERPTLLAKLLLALDGMPEEEVDDPLRASVELLLVNALDESS